MKHWAPKIVEKIKIVRCGVHFFSFKHFFLGNFDVWFTLAEFTISIRKISFIFSIMAMTGTFVFLWWNWYSISHKIRSLLQLFEGRYAEELGLMFFTHLVPLVFRSFICGVGVYINWISGVFHDSVIIGIQLIYLRIWVSVGRFSIHGFYV